MIPHHLGPESSVRTLKEKVILYPQSSSCLITLDSITPARARGPHYLQRISTLLCFLRRFGIDDIQSRKDLPRYTQKLVDAYNETEVTHCRRRVGNARGHTQERGTSDSACRVGQALRQSLRSSGLVCVGVPARGANRMWLIVIFKVNPRREGIQ